MKHNLWKKCLYIFILLHPFLDIMASYIRFGSFSVSTILRPLLPLALLVLLFFKEKTSRKWFMIAVIVYLLYAIGHLMLYQMIQTPFAFGSLVHEAQYVIHYTYFIFTAYLFIRVFGDDVGHLKQCTFYFISLYLILLFLAIVTGTSQSTYIEGMGQMGWFNSGGSLGAILVLSLFILLPFLVTRSSKQPIWQRILFLLGLYGYLFFILGTRIGLFGALFSILFYIFAHLFVRYVIEKKYYWRFFSVLMVIVGCGVASLFLITTNRHRYLDGLKEQIKDPDSGEVIHIAYDILVEEKKYIAGQGVMDQNQGEALVRLNEIANREAWDSVDLRKQQLYYHTYLYQNQNHWGAKLLGNGYLANMGALTLEMEVVALFYNFGILGFLLYLGPFLGLLGYGIYQGIRNFSKIDVEYVMETGGLFLSMVISFLAGHVFFNTAVMIVLFILMVLYWNKIADMRRKKQ